MKIIWILFLTAALVGCSNHQDARQAVMLKHFAELDSNLVAGIALANSNELHDIADAITLYSNRAMRAEICPTNFVLASNQLAAAIHENVMDLALEIHFYEQAARAKRCTVSNQVLASKLAWFYTNTTPPVERTVSNDITGIGTNLLVQLYAARNDDLIAACAEELLLLVDRMSNNAAQESQPQKKPAKYPPAQAALPSGHQSINGVPAVVYAGIKAHAVARWPNDYDMQAYEIKRQCEAYLKVNP
jgi:hypothetical protein